ncbi:hypothetical protein FD755_003246 [Muntiacus reevesi]|uniref:Cytosolic carboxypeptidase N-terminal domain-containing protein n=1 Tax=Muntiacus reevesi TaxID=9886 RepID=A0A5J5NC72_MUNRE|nr:hypothetical protein FD755_003246 [Muntiacus reevesi]
MHKDQEGTSHSPFSFQSSPTPQFKSINSSVLSFIYSPTLISIHDYWKNHSFDYTDLCWQSNVTVYSLDVLLSQFGTSSSFYVWQRLPPKNVYYYRCPDHRKNYVMSFAFCFDREEDIYQFAYCYPYTYTRFQHYLDSLQKRNMDYFFREQLGQSVVTRIQQQRVMQWATLSGIKVWGEGRRSSSWHFNVYPIQ